MIQIISFFWKYIIRIFISKWDVILLVEIENLFLFFSSAFSTAKHGLSLDFLVKVLMNIIWKTYYLPNFKMEILKK